MLGLAASLAKGGASLLTYVKDNLKLYLDFKSNKHDTLKFPCEGSTSFVASSSQYINCGNSSSLSFASTEPFSISAWVYYDTIATRTIIGKGSASGSDYEWRLFTDGSSHLNFALYNPTASAYIGRKYSSAITTGSWHHISATYNGGTACSGIEIYLNGIAVSDADYAHPTGTFTGMTNNNADVIIGKYTNYFDGKMANVAIWSRVLQPEEIQSIKNKSYSQLGSVEKTSLAMWQSLDSVDATGYMDTPGSGTGAITTSFPTNIYLNSHGTTEYTEVMANNGNLTTQGAWTIESGGTDSAFADTGVYSQGAFKIKNQIIAKLAVNSTNASVLEALIVGQLYKFEITYTRVDGEHAQSWYIGLSQNIHDGASSNIIFKEGYWNNDDDGAPEKTITGYFFHQTGNNFLRIRSLSSIEIQIKTISIKKVSNNASGGGISITNNNDHYNATLTQGATTTTSVYGSNAPVLPRAVSNEYGEAEKIGNGSASFDASNTDYIVTASNIGLDGGKSRTFSAWIRPNNNPTSGNIYDILSYGGFSTSNYFEWGIWNDSDTIKAWVNLYGSDFAVAQTFTSGEWYHYAVVYTAINSTTGTLKLYINGILLGTSGTLGGSNAINTTNDQLDIGRRSNDSGYFNGEIAQLGAWAGALTQAQIQSVMESTSYAKIPADVKSTLGSELIPNNDYSTNDSTGYTAITSGWTFSGGTAIWSGLEGATGNFYTATDIFDDTSALYKVTIDVASISNCKVRLLRGGVNVMSAHTDTAGVYTTYATITGTGPGVVGLTNGSGTTSCVLNSVSVKKVTNDIVAFYPLDSGENSNMSKDYTVADSLMTFGNNLLADGDAGSDGWTNDTGGTNPPAVNEKSSEYAKEGTFSRKFVADGGTDAVHTPTFTTETGATYQVSFWIRGSTSHNFYIYQGDGSGTNTFIAEATSPTWLRSYNANQWNKLVGYFTESGGGSNAYLKFQSPSSSDVTYYIDEVKVKKVLSGNYGRLL